LKRQALKRVASLSKSAKLQINGVYGVSEMSNRFTQYILIAMVLGIVMGTLIFNYMPDSRVELAGDINLIAMLFLRLIKMIIAPLVFATLVGGIAHMGSGAKLGRIFAKTMGWFVSASFVSLLLGLVMVNLLQPGANFPGAMPWEGGQKVWHDSIFVLPKPQGRWLTGFKLPHPIAYGVCASAPEGVLCAGGSDAHQDFREVFLLSWKNGKIEIRNFPPLPQMPIRL